VFTEAETAANNPTNPISNTTITIYFQTIAFAFLIIGIVRFALDKTIVSPVWRHRRKQRFYKSNDLLRNGSNNWLWL